jgi:amino acid transporter
VRRALAIILFIVGVAAIVAGVLYLTQPAHSLPTFFPGYAVHVVAKHTKRGYAGIALGAVLVIVAFVVALTGPRRGARLVGEAAHRRGRPARRGTRS